ncbi:MAG: glutamate synthase [Firmicutes bacterium]|nr:glutamate synthase [Alicyclobacillaceae bacterium]MCL6497849.1 glutamate synthase [Bacillota bacterium]
MRSSALTPFIGSEHDACALFAAVSKRAPTGGDPSLWELALDSLHKMSHRAGWIRGVSDGSGLEADIPRAAWQRRLDRSHAGYSAWAPNFWVLELVVSPSQLKLVERNVRTLAPYYGFSVLLLEPESEGRDQFLISFALWQERLDAGTEFAFLNRLEQEFPGQVASFSPHTMVWKVVGSPDDLTAMLNAYPGYQPRALMAHNRFSTNTERDLRRVQPFLHLAHNGEINTIDRLMRELEELGVQPLYDGSDSQNLDRALTYLLYGLGMPLPEALRFLVMPSPAMMRQLSPADQEDWLRLRQAMGPLAQGPAALLTRHGNVLAAAVDALGLRPLWLLETAELWALSSEPHVIDPTEWVAEPKLIGPGEIVALSWEAEGPVTVYTNQDITAAALRRFRGVAIQPRWEPAGARTADVAPSWRYLADGWRKDDVQLVETWYQEHREPIGSLGFDAPLAALDEDNVQNVADYLQEVVAVVTNPALDREREAEHFSLLTYLGPRPALDRLEEPVGRGLWLPHPWLGEDDLRAVVSHFGERVTRLTPNQKPGETELEAVERIAQAAVAAVLGGAHLLVLDDATAYAEGVALDVHLAIAGIDRALRSQGLRRKVGLVVRSGMLRNLHDLALALGLGADALDPYLIWQLCPPDQAVRDVFYVLSSGLEKVLSTTGCHELDGYGRSFAGIGLPREIGQLLNVPTYFAPDLSAWNEHRALVAEKRLQAEAEAVPGKEPRLPRFSHRNNRLFKSIGALAEGKIDANTYEDHAFKWAQEMPINIRHVLSVKYPKAPTRKQPSKVDISIDGYDLPFVIASMSYGSQGETAFRAYAEAAKALNMLAMNGEGGEIRDMLGRYYRWRGHQIASGRFGVNTALLNGARFLEIKIGQGAKPGEGGHLPGKKVSEKVAQARNALPGIDLISPNNNHDLYSIEDLAQLIFELKTANPDAKVVVKCPVVPNIGTIAVGIVKAGADVVTLSGFEGGTGAARLHALRHVGLPADVGVPLVHAALSAAGLRDQAEIWCDGGMRSAEDALKMILLGANRVGYATLAMMALGCTACRGCQLDTCHVGITTQIETVEEARERGLKKFEPQVLDVAVEHLVRVFRSMGQSLAGYVEQLGETRLQNLVGRWDLLQQEHYYSVVNVVGYLDQLQEALQRAVRAESAVLVATGTDAVPASISPPSPNQRAIGTGLAHRGHAPAGPIAVNRVAGQGFGAFNGRGLSLVALGGAQDGVGKSAMGGEIVVLKTQNQSGTVVGGFCGKSLAYGAQAGTFIVQGQADARAGVRLAGANVVILNDVPDQSLWSWVNWGPAAIKGFGFEYMTRGVGIILGDPGPWLCAGMTGGVLYLELDPDRGLTLSVLQDRLATNAKIQWRPLEAPDIATVRRLLGLAQERTRETASPALQAKLARLLEDPARWMIKAVPEGMQADPNVSTE